MPTAIRIEIGMAIVAYWLLLNTLSRPAFGISALLLTPAMPSVYGLVLSLTSVSRILMP